MQMIIVSLFGMQDRRVNKVFWKSIHRLKNRSYVFKQSLLTPLDFSTEGK